MSLRERENVFWVIKNVLIIYSEIKYFIGVENMQVFKKMGKMSGDEEEDKSDQKIDLF